MHARSITYANQQMGSSPTGTHLFADEVIILCIYLVKYSCTLNKKIIPMQIYLFQKSCIDHLVFVQILEKKMLVQQITTSSSRDHSQMYKLWSKTEINQGLLALRISIVEERDSSWYFFHPVRFARINGSPISPLALAAEVWTNCARLHSVNVAHGRHVCYTAMLLYWSSGFSTPFGIKSTIWTSNCMSPSLSLVLCFTRFLSPSEFT